MRFICDSCNSSYDGAAADRLLYFHACAPIGVNPDGSPKERPNKRDENFTGEREPPAPPEFPQGRPKIKRQGAGHHPAP